MSLPLVYHDDYSPPLPPGHRFPMEKFRLLRDHLVTLGMTTDAALLRPSLCSRDILTLAHDADYVARYCSGEMGRDELRRLGLPWSPELAQRTVRAVGGSLHCEKNFPTRKAHSDWDIPLPPGMGDEAYLQVVHDTLNYLLPIYQPDLVLYDAGVDVHRDDALGLLSLTDAGLAARDSAVLDHCLGRDIPVVGLIGGGYDKDRALLARRHATLHVSAHSAWQRHGLG